MKRVCMVLVVWMAMGVLLQAQDTPKGEFFIGYAYVKNFDLTSGAGTDNNKGFNLNGWNSAVSYNLNRVVGIVGEFSGSFGSRKTTQNTIKTDLSVSMYTFLVGPRLYARSKSRVTPFVHALFGGTYQPYSGSSTASSGATTKVDDTTKGFAAAIGGGLDYNLGPRISLRLGQLDYRYTRAFMGNNFRYSAGLLFKF